MKELLQSFIESLRDELKNYGEMLALLDHQQQLVVLRQGPDLLQSVASVDAQAAAVQAARQERDRRSRELALALRVDPAMDLREFSRLLPAEYQPLVQALVEENHELLIRVRQRARQNHLLLSRTVELMQRLIQTFSQGTTAPTYTAGGLTPAASRPPLSFYESVG